MNGMSNQKAREGEKMSCLEKQREKNVCKYFGYLLQLVYKLVQQNFFYST